MEYPANLMHAEYQVPVAFVLKKYGVVQSQPFHLPQRYGVQDDCRSAPQDPRQEGAALAGAAGHESSSKVAIFHGRWIGGGC